METLWSPIIAWIKMHPGETMAWVVLVVFVLWMTDQILYSTICKNISAQAKDWRMPRKIARIVWSEMYIKHVKVLLVAEFSAMLAWVVFEYLVVVAVAATISILVSVVFFLLLCYLMYVESNLIKAFAKNEMPGKNHSFLCYMRGEKFKWLVLDSRRVRGANWKAIFLEGKCTYYDGWLNSLYMSLNMPATYKTKGRTMETEVHDILKDTDARVTYGSRASPANVKATFLQHSIPLDPDDYREHVHEPDEGPGPVIREDEVSLERELRDEYGQEEEVLPPRSNRGRVIRGHSMRGP